MLLRSFLPRSRSGDDPYNLDENPEEALLYLLARVERTLLKAREDPGLWVTCTFVSQSRSLVANNATSCFPLLNTLLINSLSLVHCSFSSFIHSKVPRESLTLGWLEDIPGCRKLNTAWEWPLLISLVDRAGGVDPSTRVKCANRKHPSYSSLLFLSSTSSFLSLLSVDWLLLDGRRSCWRLCLRCGIGGGRGRW